MTLVYYFDVGNTRAKFWRCQDGVVEAHTHFAHSGDMAAVLSHLPTAFRDIPQAICGASVLSDEALLQLSSACLGQWGILPVFARSAAHHAGVTSAYATDPARLGVDRWLALIALHALHQDVCVVDCGTAITIDVLRADGQHLGGYILPGLLMMEDSLLRDTHRVRFDPADVVGGIGLGKSTGEAVRHGALAAIVALLERLVAGQGLQLVLTGGDALRVSASLGCAHQLQPELLLSGLQRYFADAGIN